jgi:putative transposase
MSKRAERSSRVRYSEQEKRAIVQQVARLGFRAVARQRGIADGTLGGWLRKYRLRAGPAEEQKARGVELSQEGSATAVEAADSAKGGVVKMKPRKVARSYTPSQRAEILEYAAGQGVTAATKKFGVSGWSVHSWRRQVAKAVHGQPDPTSGPDPKRIEEQRDREILAEWKRHPGLGPSQIRNQLRRQGVKVSVHTTRRVMEDAGYRPPKVCREPHDQRFEAVRPNHLWHLDFVHRFINRASTYTLILLDDFSRFVVGHGVADAERADLVLDTFEQAVSRYGRPEMVIHDKGAAFWSWRGISRFTALLTELGIDQIEAKCKEWNGKLEVFNANLTKELFDAQHFYDLAEMRRRLAAHLHWYNHQRTSHALGGVLVPADRFYGRVDEVMARIEAGVAQGQDLHAIDLRDRAVDLFKVVSRGGLSELWLMGRKVWTFEQ